MDINDQYEKQHLKAVKAYQRQVLSIYEQTLLNVFQAAIGVKPKRDTFRVTDYPNLEAILDKEIQQLSKDVEGLLVNGIEKQWELSADKFGVLVDKRYNRPIPSPLKRIIYDANKPALKAFLNRKTNGLNLSDRVWQQALQFRNELEQGLYVGISEGKPAKQMASEMKRYLNEPDKLFRRVRDANGKLQLSKAAKAYKPGQGVYRSSYKNALRLTRTETNMAYRASDHERWKKSAFVKNIEIKLSNAHPMRDVCDDLKGIYPKDFKFVGWHSNCLCMALPVLPDEEEYSKYEDAILNGTDEGYEFKDRVTDIPSNAKKWLIENKERVAGWKNKPYFIKDNSQYTAIEKPT
jgi:hypothetical protein